MKLNLVGTSLLVLVVLVIIFFVIRRVSCYFTQNKSTGNTLAWITVIVLAPIAYVYVAISFVFSPDRKIPDIKFDRIAWMNDPDTRFQMSKDLIWSKQLIGKDTNFLKSLLGEPQSRHSEMGWTYQMGSEPSGFGWVFYDLKIQIKSNQVISAVRSETID